MSAEERLAEWTPARLIQMIAQRSASYAAQAGVGGMETAGGIVAFLAEHPEHIEPFINGGIFELPPDWCMRGGLTYHAINGEIVHPQTAQHARIIKQLAKDSGQ